MLGFLLESGQSPICGTEMCLFALNSVFLNAYKELDERGAKRMPKSQFPCLNIAQSRESVCLSLSLRRGHFTQ